MWLWLWTAFAGVPDDVRPVAAPVDAPAQYASWLKETGQPAAELACDVLWADHALLCFRTKDRGAMRWVTGDDLKRWKVTVASLRAEMTTRSALVLTEQPVRSTIADVAGHYWLAAEGDGWSVAGVLNPDLLGARVGTPLVAALPTGDTLLAWNPGDAELDKVMSVGVRKMYDERAGSVTPMVHRWDGTAWVPFGVAVPEAP